MEPRAFTTLATESDHSLRSEIQGLLWDIRTGTGSQSEAIQDQDEREVFRGSGSVSVLPSGLGSGNETGRVRGYDPENYSVERIANRLFLNWCVYDTEKEYYDEALDFYNRQTEKL